MRAIGCARRFPFGTTGHSVHRATPSALVRQRSVRRPLIRAVQSSIPAATVVSHVRTGLRRCMHLRAPLLIVQQPPCNAASAASPWQPTTVSGLSTQINPSASTSVVDCWPSPPPHVPHTASNSPAAKALTHPMGNATPNQPPFGSTYMRPVTLWNVVLRSASMPSRTVLCSSVNAKRPSVR